MQAEGAAEIQRDAQAVLQGGTPEGQMLMASRRSWNTLRAMAARRETEAADPAGQRFIPKIQFCAK